MSLRTGVVTLGVRRDAMLVRADVLAAVEDSGLELEDFAPPGESVAAAETSDRAIDPICHMRVTKGPDALTHEHGGSLYYFCAPYCLDLFQKDPARHLR